MMCPRLFQTKPEPVPWGISNMLRLNLSRLIASLVI